MKQGSLAGWLIVAALLLLTAGCYHLRLNPDPLDSVSFTVSRPQPQVFAEIQRLLEKDGFRMERVDPAAGYLLTDYRFFRNESGFGQPEGGRDYFYKLQISLRPQGSGTEVRLEPTALELRSAYILDEAEGLTTLKKRYPYDHYPGMFELSYLAEELGRVRALLGEVPR